MTGNPFGAFSVFPPRLTVGHHKFIKCQKRFGLLLFINLIDF
jgi:hypothetical protein